MRPEILLYGSALFFACLIFHILHWRIKPPRSGSLVLLIVFIALPSMLAAFAVTVSDGFLSLSRVEVLEALLLHLSLSLVYIASYPAVRAVSPSLDILLIISSSPEKRFTKQEIIERYTGTGIVTDRIDDLLTYSLIVKRGERLYLKPLATAIVLVFTTYRKLLALPVGGG